jgi:hypothetical protein
VQNRVYQRGAAFPEQREDAVIRDANGEAWRATESGLVLERDSKTHLSRVPAQRAF